MAQLEHLQLAAEGLDADSVHQSPVSGDATSLELAAMLSRLRVAA
jgi:hypothetical protein